MGRGNVDAKRCANCRLTAEKCAIVKQMCRGRRASGMREKTQVQEGRVAFQASFGSGAHTKACGEKCKSGLDTGKRNGTSMHHWGRERGSDFCGVSERDVEISREVSPLTGLQPVEGDRDVAALSALG